MQFSVRYSVLAPCLAAALALPMNALPITAAPVAAAGALAPVATNFAATADSPAAVIHVQRQRHRHGGRPPNWNRGQRPPPNWNARARTAYGPRPPHGPRRPHYGHRPPPPYYGRGYYDNNDDWGPAAAAGIIGLAAGAIAGAAISQPNQRSVIVQNPGGYGAAPYSAEWYRLCDIKYKSFRASDGTYLGYDGVRHVCRLP